MNDHGAQTIPVSAAACTWLYNVEFEHSFADVKFGWPPAVKRQMQEQQLHARIAVLQQQAQSAVAAASKTQREVRRFRATIPKTLCTSLAAAAQLALLATCSVQCSSEHLSCA